jgi:4-hydroxybenzoate polyprenyltransferase/phosphoserine phosphatase
VHRTFSHSSDWQGRQAPPVTEDPVLVVDLDVVLLRSSLRFEALLNAVSSGGRSLADAFWALFRGRARLEEGISDNASLDPATMPYNSHVLEHIRAWRADGGRVVLISGHDSQVAQSISAHLRLFDDVFSPKGGEGLTGKKKADRIVDAYGKRGFTYLTDSRADLPVLEQAAAVIVVGAGRALKRSLAVSDISVEHIPPHVNPTAAFFHSLRPYQWLKNTLVFFPIIGVPGSGDWEMAAMILAFSALCLTASAGYVIKDLLDLADDCSHPRKRQRPFASGALSTSTGTMFIPVLLALGLFCAALVSNALLAVTFGYFLLTMAYSAMLKRHEIFDICTLAGLYTIRVIAGAVAIGVGPSVWVIAFSLFLFFSLAAVKRLAEFSDAEAAARDVTRRGYTVTDRSVLSQMAISSGYISVLVLALYLDEPYVQQNFGAHRMFWGVCALLIFWISRTTLVANRGSMDDDPLVWSLRDPFSQMTIALIITLTAIAVWW